MGHIPRKAAKCPKCYSLERHRFLFLIYRQLFLNTKKAVTIMHTAPEQGISSKIINNKNINYFPIDLKPEQYRHVQCLKEDVLSLSFDDNKFDYIISNHILEHLDDEETFFKECLRVLKANGKLLITFPIRFDLEKTFEDKSITSEADRERVYGQKDHVRLYGTDIIDKLKTLYNAQLIYPNDVLSGSVCALCSTRNDPVFIITKGHAKQEKISNMDNDALCGLKKLLRKRNIKEIEKIVSVKNDGIFKVVTVLGLQFRFLRNINKIK